MKVPAIRKQRLAFGAVALCLLLFVAELGVVFWVRGLSLAKYVSGRNMISGPVYVVILLVFAVMPAIVVQRQTEVGTG